MNQSMSTNLDQHNHWIKSTGKWLSQALFNYDSPRAYFDVLTESVDPLWSLTQTRARVLEVIQETPDVVTLVLQPVSRWGGFSAGQFVQLGVWIKGAHVTRTFSLSSAPAQWIDRGVISVTLKRIPNGKVTGWIHDHVRAGDVVSLSDAAGEFILPEHAGRVLYIAAGSGITPIMSHLRERAAKYDTAKQHGDSEENQTTLVFYANRQEDFIFSRDLAQMARKYSWFKLQLIDTEVQGQINKGQLVSHLRVNPDTVFICGPTGFREKAEVIVQSLSSNSRILQEAFSLAPMPLTEGTDTQEHQMRLKKSGREVTVTGQMTLLDQVEAAGLSPTSGCRMGICYTCKCQKTSGRVKNILTGELSDNGAETIQLCVSVPVTDVELAL